MSTIPPTTLVILPVFCFCFCFVSSSLIADGANQPATNVAHPACGIYPSLPGSRQSLFMVRNNVSEESKIYYEVEGVPGGEQNEKEEAADNYRSWCAA